MQQLHRLRRRLPLVDGSTTWVTYDGPQARSLLAGEDALFVGYIGARQPGRVLAAIPEAVRVMRDRRVTEVITTGSQVALAFALPASVRKVDFHFIESAARHDGPSLTGSMVRRLPGIRYYSQYRNQMRPGVRYAGSVFEGFRAHVSQSRSPSIRRAVVALGTFRGYGFRRLLENARRAIPDTADVLWQTGDTDVSDMAIDGYREIPSRDLFDAMRDADVVITHAGVGSALASLEAGKLPILVPRRSRFREHVDDHQTQIADELSRAGLAATVDADQLNLELLEQVAAIEVADDGGPPFRIERRDLSRAASGLKRNDATHPRART